jgi:hypothetical protein
VISSSNIRPAAPAAHTGTKPPRSASCVDVTRGGCAWTGVDGRRSGARHFRRRRSGDGWPRLRQHSRDRRCSSRDSRRKPSVRRRRRRSPTRQPHRCSGEYTSGTSGRRARGCASGCRDLVATAGIGRSSGHDPLPAAVSQARSKLASGQVDQALADLHRRVERRAAELESRGGVPVDGRSLRAVVSRRLRTERLRAGPEHEPAARYRRRSDVPDRRS